MAKPLNPCVTCCKISCICMTSVSLCLRQHDDTPGKQGSADTGCRLSQTSGDLVNSTAFFPALVSGMPPRPAVDPLDDPLRFCYDVPRLNASHTECGYRQQYFCGKAHRGMVEYNGRQ